MDIYYSDPAYQAGLGIRILVIDSHLVSYGNETIAYRYSPTLPLSYHHLMTVQLGASRFISSDKNIRSCEQVRMTMRIALWVWSILNFILLIMPLTFHR